MSQPPHEPPLIPYPSEPYSQEHGDPSAGSLPGKRRVALIALVVAVAVLLATTSLFWLVVSMRAAPVETAAGAQLGDCLVFDADQTSYLPADCGNPAAEFRLLAVRADRAGCVDVPGTTRAYREDTAFYCIGDKAVDPAATLNGIGAGDCVTVRAGEPVPAACEAGSLPVLAVVPDVPRGDDSAALAAACSGAGAERTRQTYAWGIGSDTELPTWDRLLCLGAANP